MLESLIIAILVIALIVWLIGFIPLDARLKQILYVVVAVVGIIYLLRFV